MAERADLGSDAELARLLATHASVILLRLRGSLRGVPAERVSLEGRRRAQDFLQTALRRLRPGDAVLTAPAVPHGVVDARPPDADRVWLLCPLDGAREYGEAGRTDWAMHVALCEQGRLTTGAVALPGLGPTLSSEDPPRPQSRHVGPLRIVVDRNGAPPYAAAIAGPLGAELLAMGSVGAKAMAVARGEADIYLHDGARHEADCAGPVAVALAAGLHVSRLDGSPPRFASSPPHQPDLLICRADLAGAVLAALATAR